MTSVAGWIGRSRRAVGKGHSERYSHGVLVPRRSTGTFGMELTPHPVCWGFRSVLGAQEHMGWAHPFSLVFYQPQTLLCQIPTPRSGRAPTLSPKFIERLRKSFWDSRDTHCLLQQLPSIHKDESDTEGLLKINLRDTQAAGSNSHFAA